MLSRLLARSILTLFILTLSTVSLASSKSEIDAKVKAALETFYAHSPDSKQVVQEAKGILVFPEITKAGIIIGAEYGEGALVVDGYVDGYYRIAGGSLGLQAGVQVHGQIVVFLTDKALSNFRNIEGWNYGLDGGVAIADIGAGGQLNNKTATSPVIVYIFDNKGLMAAANISANKITRISPDA